VTTASENEGQRGAGRAPRRLLTPARLRFWGVVLPIHVAAFAVLAFGTYRLLERAYVQAGASAARLQLDQAIAELPFLVQAARAGRNPHVFEHLMAAHQPIGLRLYRADGSPLGSPNISPDAAELELVAQHIARYGKKPRAWVEEQGDRAWVRGVMAIDAGPGCSPCHAAGKTLGYATMKLDFTAELDEIGALLGRRVVALVAAWAALIGLVAIVVQQTVKRSVRRLEADLASAAAGDSAESTPTPGPIPLDPVAAEIHRSLRDFLTRQRKRDANLAGRLARADQLASLGQLAAGLAHEIKNPLAGIQGALELLRDETVEDSTKTLYGEMLGELKRVHEILQRLLESGRPAPLRLATTDLSRLLGDLRELLAPSLRRKRVELRIETAENLPELRIDAAKMRQVLINLVQNAGEAMGESGSHVVVRASGFPAEHTVVIAVEDDGPGIAPADQVRLFEPFFTTKFAGTGLGLAISKTLVEQHGGRLEVDSELGRGTRFLIVLPERGPSESDALAENG